MRSPDNNRTSGFLNLQDVSPPLVWVLGGAVMATLILMTAYARVTANKSRASFPDAADTYYLPPASTLKIASLGHVEAMADLVWVRAVLYFGEKMSTRSQQTYLRRYVDTVIRLNPRFQRVYRWAGAVMIYNMRRITNESVWASIHYLEKGHRMFPKDWHMLFSLASNYLYELKTKDPDLRRKWRRVGADYLWKAANLGGGPAYLHSLAAKVWSEQGRFNVAHRRLKEVYLSTENPKIRESVRRRMVHLLATREDRLLTLERLGLHSTLTGFSGAAMMGLAAAMESAYEDRRGEASSRKVEDIIQHQKEFEKNWKRDLPYGSADLYILLGPRPEQR